MRRNVFSTAALLLALLFWLSACSKEALSPETLNGLFGQSREEVLAAVGVTDEQVEEQDELYCLLSESYPYRNIQDGRLRLGFLKEDGSFHQYTYAFPYTEEDSFEALQELYNGLEEDYGEPFSDQFQAESAFSRINEATSLQEVRDLAHDEIRSMWLIEDERIALEISLGFYDHDQTQALVEISAQLWTDPNSRPAA